MMECVVVVFDRYCELLQDAAFPFLLRLMIIPAMA